MKRLVCNQPDHDVPKLRCGAPLPCPYHTATITLDNPPTVAVPVTANQAQRHIRKLAHIAKALKPVVVLALALAAGVVEAGEPIQGKYYGPNATIHTAPHDACIPWGNGVVIAYENVDCSNARGAAEQAERMIRRDLDIKIITCEQRMRAAMTAMEQSLKDESNQKDRKQPVWMIPELLKPSNWNSTMRDCVHGARP
jgi:hypothetical protein